MTPIYLCLVIDAIALLVGLICFLSGWVPTTTPAIIAAIFGFIGVNMVLGSLYSYNNTRKWLANSVSTSGEVIGHERKDSYDSSKGRTTTYYYPTVRFQTRAGAFISFTSSVGTSPPSHTTGERVNVRYLADQPGDAQIDEFISLWLLPLVFCFIGVTMLIASVGITFFHVRS